MAGVEASSLVFAHTVQDELATSILHFLAEAEPERWEQKIDGKKLPFSEVKTSSTSDLRARLLQKLVEQLSKDLPLPKRIGLVFGETKATPDLIRDFGYDEERIQRLDVLRHGIVHKDRLGERIPNLNDDLQFMFKSGIAVITALSQHLSVQANPVRLFGLGTK